MGHSGVWVGPGGWPDDGAAGDEAAAELEELGYRTVWFGGSPGDLRRPERTLSATSRLVAATGIVNVWGDDPADVAAAFHRVNDAYPDRLLLGVGAGHATFVEQAGGTYRRPYSKVAEYLYGLDAAVRPVPAPARAVAALGPRTVALAGERSAGAHPYLVNPEHTATAREILGAGPLLAPEQKVVLETDRDRARAIATPALEFYLGLRNYVANLRRLGFTEDDVSGGGSERLFEALIAWGDEDSVVRRVREHRDAGADHVCVQVLTGRTGPDSLPHEQWRRLAPALT
ncbi:LLM class F420-dependent oxidoreductase [Haloactinopolyspora alba]|uniref:LLM class F420-dependent oxidoreductase n=1 Tax=Haloactinopolyspora alba TaxID=648780 RepID=UPI001F0EE8DB|nr:LLM class F420-dependent oxidoreductase [Haloactinopolyspora alba]